MFVIPPYLKFAIIAGGLLLGIALWIAFGFWYAFPFLLAGLIVLASYLFLGTVGSAAKLVQAQDFDGAEKTLNMTLKPDWLYGPNRAFYYMMRGNIALSRKQLDEGERYLKMAEQVDIPTANERAMLHLQLAQIEAQRKRFPAAKLYLKKAKDAKVSLPQIKEQIEMMENALKQTGQVKAAQRMGRAGHQMMQRSGKRRRPKNR